MASTGTSLEGKLVVLVGGSGFFGTHLAQELLSAGARLRIASRNPERAFKLKPLANLGQVQFARCDMTKPESLARVLAGADAVVNLVGAFTGNLDAVQGQGAGTLARLAREAGAAAFVHVSAIGSDAEGATAYARSKAAGEAASEDYVKNRYHQPSDQYDPSWDWSGAVQETALYYRLGRMLAMTTDWPNWHPTDEFRAVRDQSRAAGGK